ncbi:MAG: TonB-dependent receptor, partial [Rhizobacter sp.]|nr:TonB-dependent receptor [Chlorobiales bacterium]
GIRADYTERADFALNIQDVQATVVVVTAERPIVIKDQTSSVAVVTADEIRALPVENFDQVVQIQAGVVGGRFRGGRANEVAYLVDGISVQDVFDGSKGGANTVEPAQIQELQVITGAFNAEYGQALSGVVNIVTKDGGEQFSGNLQIYSGDYLTTRTALYPDIASLTPFAGPNLQGYLSGPILSDMLTFYVSGRAFYNEGYLYGIRQYNTGDALNGSNAANPYAALETPLPAIQGRFATGDQGFGTFTARDAAGNSIPISLGTDGRAIIDRQAGTNVYVPYDVSQAQYTSVFGDYSNLGTGDGKPVPLNPFTRYSAQGKLSFRPGDRLRMTANVLFEYEQSRGYDHGYSRNPDGQTYAYRNGLTAYLTGNYTLSNTTFLTAAATLFQNRFQSYLYDDPLDPRYQFRTDGIGDGNFFLAGGTKNDRYDRQTRTLSLKADITSQLDRVNLVKLGAEVKQHRLNYETIALREQANVFPYQPEVPSADEFGRDVYAREPTEFSAYAQDKLEFGSFIINIGLRFDYFNPQTSKPRYEPDPSPFLPILDDAEYARRTGIESELVNGVLPEGARFVAVSPKYAFSPRLGVSFPISDRSVVHFSFGQFFQMPSFELLYANALYKYAEADQSTFVAAQFGNPDMRPQKTTSTEIGIQQQLGNDFGIDLTLYARDIRDLASSARQIRFVSTGNYLIYDNADYAIVRGFILSADKRLSQNFRFSVDYTFQVAEGNASDPGAAAQALRANQQPETRILPLDWDQRHTLNGSLNFESSGLNIGMIGRYGSGFPYTPVVIDGQEVTSTVLTNALLKPPSVTVDLRATYQFRLGTAGIALFGQVFNLFDAPNENNVYGTTGRAGYTVLSAVQQQSRQTLNTRSDFFRRPDFYAEPRRISFGTTITF